MSSSIPEPTAVDLVRLRWLVEHALALAEDRSDPGRHLAVIALDAAVEYALWLVANTIDAHVRGGERPSFAHLTEAVMNALQELDRPWNRAGRAGVDQLRRARNPAQHAGVATDAEQLGGWAQAAGAYIDSLVRAAFDIGLVDAQLALAVGDPQLRQRLASAERAIDAGDGEIGFSQSWIAFEVALGRWRQTRRGLPDGWATAPAVLLPGPEQQLRSELAELQALSDVTPFAADVGEYLALRRSRSEQEQAGWHPEVVDARRALRFAVGWIVRWEVFDRGYPAERWQAFHDAIEPPTTRRDRPSIVSISAYAVLTETGNRRWLVRAQLADLPERGRGDWGVDFVSCLAAALHDAGGQPTNVQRASTPSRAGVVTIQFTPDVDADVLRAALPDAVDRADASYRERRAQAEATEARRERAETVWRALVADAADGLLDLRDVQVEQRADGLHMIGRLSIDASSDVELLASAELLRSHGGWFASAGVHDGLIVIDADPVAETAAAELRSGLIVAAAQLRRRRAEVAAERERFDDFARRLAEAWPADPV